VEPSGISRADPSGKVILNIFVIAGACSGGIGGGEGVA
jgi:hypothetical protein